MHATRISKLAIALIAVCALADAVAAQKRVRWRERFHATDALPADMPEAACAAISAWAGWAEEGGYRLDLEDGGRVLLVSPASGAVWRAQMRLVDRTISRFESTLPAPPRNESAAAPGRPPAVPGPAPLPEDPGDGPLPEDPEGEPPGFGDPPDPGGAPGEEAWSTAWGVGAGPRDSETIVFFVVRGEGDYRALTERLARDQGYLAGWAEAAQRYTGFTLAQPLAGAYVVGASGQEEWHPDNELVHRLAELLLLRRFGQAPFWLVQGWAWHVEDDLLGGLYCFPYRDEFVFAVEHTAWLGDLRREFEKRREPLSIDDLYFPRGCFDGVRARRAFGAVRFLVEHRAGTLSGTLEALRVFREAHDRIVHGDGTWSSDRDYEVPLAEQARILREHAGADVFAEMAKAFRMGEAYRE